MARNSLLNLLGLGAPLVVAVFAIPPLVDGLGPQRFGLLGMIWVVAAYLNLLDLGLGRATTRYAAPALRDGDQAALGSILGAAVALQLVLGVAGGAVAALAAPPLVDRFLGLEGALRDEAVRSFVLLAAAAPALTVASSFRGVLEAGQRFAVINLIRVPVSTANFLVPLVGVVLGWSLPAIVVGMVLVRVGALFVYGAACLRSWPGLARRLGLHGGRMRELLGFGGWVTVSGVVGALLVYVDRFVLGGLRSVAEVGYYTVPHEMVTRLEILPASLVLTLFPAMAAMSGEARRGGELFDRSVLFLLALVGPLLLALAIAGGDILTLWLGADFAAQAAGALRLLALGMLANALAYIPYAAIQAAGKPQVAAAFHLIELPIHLVVLWTLTVRWGIEGAAAAWALRTALDASLLYAASGRMGLRSRGLPDRVGRVAIALAIFAAAIALATVWLASPLPAIMAVMLALLLWAAWCWKALLLPRERARLLEAVGVARPA